MCEEPQKGQGCLRRGKASEVQRVPTWGDWSCPLSEMYLGCPLQLLQQFSLPESLHIDCCLCWWLKEYSPQGI